MRSCYTKRILLVLMVVASLGWLLTERAVAADDSLVLIEAEGFDQHGGWALDPQFMDNMGSPYLLAHGLGKPVDDAVTKVKIAKAGTYKVWVRTKDWVARWNAPGTPGMFQVAINGKTLQTTFGTVGAEWHWQDGGSIELPAGETDVVLHDLTGFEGRCDAILLARDPDFVPPNADPEMAEFRRVCLGLPAEPQLAGEFDLVVTGGGIAGTCTALSAARMGLKVALIQDRPVLGGNNSSEVRVWLQGARNKVPWPRIGDVVAELEQEKTAHYGADNTAEIYEDEKKLGVVQAEPNIHLFLEHRMNGVEAEDGHINAVIAQQTRTGKRFRFKADLFADCTGDACVGALAGADFEMQAEDHMGPCNLWSVCECKDLNAINTGTQVSDEPVPFPRCPWALDLSDKPFPGRSKDKPNPLKLGGWYWESGFDRDPIKEMEYVRDWNFRAMYGAWDAMKNVDKVLPNHELNWCAYILGKRESRRLMGDVVLNLNDLKTDRQFLDGCVPTGWSNDLHYADKRYNKGFEGDAFIAKANHGDFPARAEQRPFWIPYRSLYSRNIDNLLMAGRCISVTHDALGAVRVMRTCGCQGEIIGMAAGLCKKHNTTPRGVYQDHFSEMQVLMASGMGRKPATDSPGPGRSERMVLEVVEWLESAGENLAREAKVEVPAATNKVKSYLLLNDGNGRVDTNGNRWLERSELPHVVEFEWDKPIEVGAARIVSGYNTGSEINAPIEDFKLEYFDGTEWQTTGVDVKANKAINWATKFDSVKTQRVRLTILNTQNDISRVWEVEFYGPVKE
ncbi:FAD-dependent oxidoreductase [Aeoliella sp.]|uniref:FAD-dependent oxidoreductase n=1 Tax=Aeoliella sp. TaxID=2795800 RepID=UPI003CCBCFB5